MSFSKKVLLIFGSVTVLLAAFSFLAITTINKLDAGNDSLISEKIHVFLRIKEVINGAKSVEAAGAHYMITGKERAYDEFIASHLGLRDLLKELIKDSRFKEFEEDLKAAADLEIRAEEVGHEFFAARLKRTMPFQKASEILTERGLPLILEMQRRLKTVEERAIQNWQEASTSVQTLHANAQSMVRTGLVMVGVLVLLLVSALWAILRQQGQLDDNKNRLLEKEKIISNARKEAVEIVAHDLRGPLGSIRMCFDMYATAGRAETEMLTKVGKNAADTALKLVEKILDHSKIEQNRLLLEKTDCELKQLLSEQIGIFTTLCGAKGVDFISVIDGKVGHCNCDPTRLIQVLANLVGNALKFSGKGRKIEFHVSVENSECVFTIKDEGPGIPKSQVEHIFDRYWQSPQQDKKGGLGLGLAICKAVVDAHGGRIWVVSEEGRGSSFQFTVPLA